jgi:RND family efflux transporter MFP subunit
MIVSSSEIRLSFKTGGIIGFIEAEEGVRVRKGDILAVLNLSEMEAQFNQVKNGYEKALRDLARVKNLFVDSAATLEQMQDAETALNVAKANLDVVEFNLAHSKISAPDNGIVLKRLAEPGEVISPGVPVFLFGSEGRFWKIKTGLADKDFVRLQPGDSAKVSLDAYPDEEFRALVSQISESANPMTGTYEIELDLLHTDYKLASGFIANLEIYPTRKKFYSFIPIEAIIQAEGQRGYVFVVDDSMIARRQEVKVDAMFGDEAALSGWLGEATTVVTEGAAYLTEGDRVEIAQ